MKRQLDNLSQFSELKIMTQSALYTKLLYKHKKTGTKYLALKCLIGKILKNPQKIIAQILKYSSIKSKSIMPITHYLLYYNQIDNLNYCIYMSQYSSIKQIHCDTLSEEQNQDIMKKLLKGVHSVHLEQLAHNYLILENIYIINKIIKLGLPILSEIQKAQRKNKQTDTMRQVNLCLAPELKRGYCYRKQTDMWALGVIFLKLNISIKQHLQNTESILNYLAYNMHLCRYLKFNKVIAKLLKQEFHERDTPISALMNINEKQDKSSQQYQLFLQQLNDKIIIPLFESPIEPLHLKIQQLQLKYVPKIKVKDNWLYIIINQFHTQISLYLASPSSQRVINCGGIGKQNIFSKVNSISQLYQCLIDNRNKITVTDFGSIQLQIAQACSKSLQIQNKITSSVLNSTSHTQQSSLIRSYF